MTTPGYRTRQERIAISGVPDLVIRSLLDHQQFYDPTGAAERLGICSASWPLFGLLWPSSVRLAEQFAQRPVCPDERILEIGCGLALASLVGHRQGARITASDRHPLAEAFLEENASLNDLTSVQYRHGQWGTTSKPSLQDIGAEHLSARYDLVIGSDLLYERDTPEMLASFIDDHATASAEVWMVDPDRGHRSAFNRHMATYGFQLMRDTRLGRSLPSAVAAQDYKGRLLVYRRQP